MAPQSKPNNRRMRPRLDPSRATNRRTSSTTTRGSGRQRALPPGKQGGALATTGESKPENPRRTSARARQAQAAQGSRGSGTQIGSTSSITTKGGALAKRPPAPKATGGLMRGVVGAVGKGLGILSTGAAIASTAKNIVDPNSETSTNLRNAKNAVMRRMSGGKDKSQGVSTSWQGPTPSPKRKATPTPTPTPSPTPTRSSGSSSNGGGGRSYSPSPSPSRSSNPAPTPTPSPSPKPETSKSGGGAYGKDGKQLYMADKKNNPLMKRTFGYQTGDAPDQRKAKESTPSTDTKSKTGGRAAVAGSSAASSSGQANRERDILKRLAEMKKRQQG